MAVQKKNGESVRWRRGDGWLLLAVGACTLLLALGLWLFSEWTARRGTLAVEITVAGHSVEWCSLAENRELLVEGVGGTNRVVIRGGRVTVFEADCPDGICVRHRPISRSGQSIVCLPHRVCVAVVGGAPTVDGEA